MAPQTPENPHCDKSRPAALDSMTAQLRKRVEELERRCAEQQHKEAVLRASEERLRLALEGTNDGIWDWNVKTGGAYFSPS